MIIYAKSQIKRKKNKLAIDCFIYYLLYGLGLFKYFTFVGNFMKKNNEFQLNTCENKKIVKLLKGFSLEITPFVANKIENLTQFIKPSTTIFITFLPGSDYKDTINTAKKIRQEGLNPAPHLAARSIPSKEMLEDYVSRIVGEANVKKILIVGGAGKEQIGPYADTVSLLETGIFDKYGITDIGIAGHPEGSPDISDKEINQSLMLKNKFSETSDASFFIISQFCFDAEAILNWSIKINSEGNKIPIIIGLPGVAKLSTLIKYSLSCGIGNSMNFLKKQGSNVLNLVKTQEPDKIVRKLAVSEEILKNNGIQGIHIYPLGGIRKSSEWAQNIIDENFKLTREGFKVNY